jgi:hypothetical protein
MSQTINLRVDKITSDHAHATLFMNGANLGSLVFGIGEYQAFSTVLLMGVKQTAGNIIDTSDYSIFLEYAKTGKTYERIPD